MATLMPEELTGYRRTEGSLARMQIDPIWSADLLFYAGPLLCAGQPIPAAFLADGHVRCVAEFSAVLSPSFFSSPL